MAQNESVDVVLVGAGIMSATLAVLLKELDPTLKLEVVEATAGQIDRTGQVLGFDGNARRARNGGFAAGFRIGGCTGRQAAIDGRGRGRCLLLGLGLLLRDLGFLRLALGLDARVHVEELPGEDDHHR